MTFFMILGMAVMIVGVIFLLLQNIQEGRDDSINELERYMKERDRDDSRMLERINRRVETKLQNQSNQCDHTHSRRNLDGMEEVRMRAVKRIIAIVVACCILGTLAGFVFAFTRASRINLSYIQGGEDVTWNSDGSVGSKRIYGVGGICIHEYLDTGDYIRETEFDGLGRPEKIVEMTEEGVLLKEESYQNGKLCSSTEYENCEVRYQREYSNGLLSREEEYENGNVVKSTEYQIIGSGAQSIPSNVYYYDPDGSEQRTEYYDENGNLSECVVYGEETREYSYYSEGDPEWRIVCYYDENHYLIRMDEYTTRSGRWELDGYSVAILLPEEHGINVGSEIFAESGGRVLWAVGSFDSSDTLNGVTLYTISGDGDYRDYLNEYDVWWEGDEEYWAYSEWFDVEYGSDGRAVGFRYRN